MKLFIKVKPGARERKIKKVDGTHLEIWVKEPPREGRANMAVLEAVSEYFGVPKSAMRILSGSTSRLKVLEIENFTT